VKTAEAAATITVIVGVNLPWCHQDEVTRSSNVVLSPVEEVTGTGRDCSDKELVVPVPRVRVLKRRTQAKFE
jgi:hypothetical protein